MLLFVRNFFSEKKQKILNSYYKASMIGNRKLAYQQMKELLSYMVYEDNILLNREFLCLEECDLNLIKLRKALETMKGVNIDIIEETNPAVYLEVY